MSSLSSYQDYMFFNEFASCKGNKNTNDLIYMPYVDLHRFINIYPKSILQHLGSLDTGFSSTILKLCGFEQCFNASSEREVAPPLSCTTI